MNWLIKLGAVIVALSTLLIACAMVLVLSAFLPWPIVLVFGLFAFGIVCVTAGGALWVVRA